MNEINVYGCRVFGNVKNGVSIPYNYTIDNSQFPLFAYAPSLLCNLASWWLRDVASDAGFAAVSSNGIANYTDASISRGVRPAFCIG